MKLQISSKKTEKTKLLEKNRAILIFLVSAITIFFFLTPLHLRSNFLFENNINSDQPHVLSEYAYFTTQSNILVFFFYLINFFLIITKKNKFLNKWNNYYIRGTITKYILVTGIIFSFFLLPQLIYTTIKTSTIKNNIKFNNISIFFKIFIFLVLPHIVVPPLVFYDFWKYKFTKKPNYILSFLLFTAYPFFYLLLTIIIAPHNHNLYPYFFLNINKISLLYFFVFVFAIFIILIILWFLLIHRTCKKISFEKKNNYYYLD